MAWIWTQILPNGAKPIYIEREAGILSIVLECGYYQPKLRMSNPK